MKLLKSFVISILFLILISHWAGEIHADDDLVSQVLTLTSGVQTKIVWVEGTSVKGFDTNSGKIKTILDNLAVPGRPLISRDGSQVIFHTGGNKTGIKDFGKPHRTYRVNWNGTDRRLLTENGYLCSLWFDGKTEYAITMKSDRKTFLKLPLNKKGKPEIILSKGKGRAELQLSADGRRGVHGIGSTGWIDFTRKPLKIHRRYGGCRPSIAPDNSYLWFRFYSSHDRLKLFDKKGESWDVTLPYGKEESYYPRWTNHVRYLTHTGRGRFNQLFLSKFAPDFRSIEAHISISGHAPIYHPSARVGLAPQSPRVLPGS